MKFKSLFLLVLGLITVLALVYVSPASALPFPARQTNQPCCRDGDNACKKKNSNWKICTSTIPVGKPDGNIGRPTDDSPDSEVQLQLRQR